MDLLSDFFATFFYILFFIWLFIKIRNIILMKEKDCSIKYKDYKKSLKERKSFKYVRIIRLIIFIFLVIIIVNTFIKISSFLILSFVTLGGIMYDEAGGDSTLFDNLTEDTIFSFGSLVFSISSILYILVYLSLIKAIYNNILYYKMLQDYPNSMKEDNKNN